MGGSDRRRSGCVVAALRHGRDSWSATSCEARAGRPVAATSGGKAEVGRWPRSSCPSRTGGGRTRASGRAEPPRASRCCRPRRSCPTVEGKPERGPRAPSLPTRQSDQETVVERSAQPARRCSARPEREPSNPGRSSRRAPLSQLDRSGRDSANFGSLGGLPSPGRQGLGQDCCRPAAGGRPARPGGRRAAAEEFRAAILRLAPSEPDGA
jgi:hypothetical protein